MNSFTTVFEISSGFSPLQNECLGYLMMLLALFLAIVLFLITFPKNITGPKLVFLCFAAPILISFFSFRFIKVTLERVDLRKKLDSGQYEIAEGMVHTFATQPYDGHSPGDFIKVSDKTFVINYFQDTEAYNVTISRGGYLRDGVYARVYYFENKILRIDLEKSGK